MIAYDGCLLSCGHTVKASQNLMGWSDGSGESSIPEQITSKPQKYHEFFTLFDDDKNPVANQKYRLTSEDGSIIEGKLMHKGKQNIYGHMKNYLSILKHLTMMKTLNLINITSLTNNKDKRNGWTQYRWIRFYQSQ